MILSKHTPKFTRRRLGASLLLLLMAVSVQGEAKPNFVRVNNPQELQAALDRALPGEIIALEPGQYALERPISIQRSGLAALPITILAPEKKRTIFTGPFGIVVSDAEHVVLDDLIWFKIYEYPVITLRGRCAVTITGNEFHKCGLLVDQELHEERVRNTPLVFTSCYARLCHTEILLRLQNGKNQILVNTFERCGGAIQLNGDGQLFRSNYFLQDPADRNIGPHITSTPGSSTKFLNNYFSESTGSRPLLTLESPSGAAVVHNTFYHCANPVLRLSESSEATQPMKCSIENNLFANELTRLGPVIEIDGDSSLITWGNNLAFPTGLQTNMVSGASTEADRWMNLDPQLTKTGEIWRITAGSPAVDAGSNRSSSTLTDIEGKIRGLRADIGAHEISSEAVAFPQPISVLTRP